MGFQPFGKLKGWFRKSKGSQLSLAISDKDVGLSYYGCGELSEFCPECRQIYNMGKKRKLIDVCGHHRCFTCITQNENCRQCGLQQAGGPAKKLPFGQKLLSDSGRASLSPVPIQRSGAKTPCGHSNYCKTPVLQSRAGTPAVISSICSTPKLFGRWKGSPSMQQEKENGVLRTPKSTLGRRSGLNGISRIQENEVFNSHLSENDEGFEDVRKFKTSGVTLNGLERFLSRKLNQGRSLSRAGRNSQFHTSCSSLASSSGSITPSDNTNTLQSTSRGSYDTGSWANHRSSSTLTVQGNGTKSPVGDQRRRVLSPTPQGRYSSVMVRQEYLPLRPLFFEVPMTDDGVFVGRQWIFQELEVLLATEVNPNKGIVICGKPGAGKTSILLQLVEHSCFGRRPYFEIDLRYVSGRIPGEGDVSLSYSESIRSLASHVVAYQFCQVENNTSCLLPEFLHSIAAQLCQAPQLAAYREHLLDTPDCLNHLSKIECLRNPNDALLKGIIEPLTELYELKKITVDYCVIIIDAACDAEFHRSDNGDTIASFLSKHINKFPTWLKVILSVRSQHFSIVSQIPFYRMRLDDYEEAVTQDMIGYINYRMKKHDIRKHLPCGSKSDSHVPFVRRLLKSASGNYLFAKLVLDLIHESRLQVKSSDFKELPKSLSEIFSKLCSSVFPTEDIFKKVETILAVCLAGLNPLTLLEIYHSVNCLNATERLPWETFIEHFQLCSKLLVQRSDGTYMMFHSSFRDWLLQRDESDPSGFHCDLRTGHAGIALRFSRIEAPLDERKTLELGHHILKAHIYKNMPPSKLSTPPRDLQAIWLATCSMDLSSTLASPANIYYPNVKVSRLLLLAGANPNEITQWRNAPLLSVCAGAGLCEMVVLLLEFGADIHGVDEDGNCALHLAAERGQVDMARLLVEQGAHISQLNQNGECALVKAAIANQLEVVAFLLEQNWDVKSENGPFMTLAEAAHNALVAASAYGHTDIVEHILRELNPPVNCPDTLYGENPLCAAAANGRENVIELLLQHGASVNAVNLRDCPPLILAARGGFCSIAAALVAEGAPVDRKDADHRTALIVGAKEGHVDMVEILLEAGADVNLTDKDGLSPLSWASLRGHTKVVASLLEMDVDVNHTDGSGRTPLDLAAHCGSEEIAQMLLDRGALLEHVDLQGARPLDRAVGCGHEQVVNLFLKRGAKLGPATWTMATGKPNIILALLHKLLEDGNVLYRKGLVRDAVYRYQYAIRKIPVNEYDEDMQTTFDEIKMTFMLHLSRCKRKRNEELEAIHLASEVIKMQPNSPKGYHARAKAYHAMREMSEALNDVNRALELVGHNAELRRQLFRLKEELSRETRNETRTASPRSPSQLTYSSYSKRNTPLSGLASPIMMDSPAGLSAS